jgi:ABC-type enterochelin transport system substrate-binding protein
MKVVLPGMLPKFAVALAVTLLMTACAGTPREESAAADPAAAAPAAANTVASSNAGGEEEIVCRSEVVTGTAFKRRVCMTRAEWTISQRGQRRVVEEMARRTREDASVGAAASQNSAPTPGGGAVGR